MKPGHGRPDTVHLLKVYHPGKKAVKQNHPCFRRPPEKHRFQKELKNDRRLIRTSEAGWPGFWKKSGNKMGPVPFCSLSAEKIQYFIGYNEKLYVNGGLWLY